MFRMVRSSTFSSPLFKNRSSQFKTFHHATRLFNNSNSNSQSSSENIEKELIPVTVPLVGTNISNIKFNQWYKQVGDCIDYGDLIAELQQVDSPHLIIDVFSQRRGIMQEQLINEGNVVNCGDAISMIEVVKMSQEEMNDEMLFNSAANQEQQQQNEQTQKQGRFSAFLDLWIVIVGVASIYFAINPDTQKQEETGRKDEVEQENIENSGNLEIVKGKEENFAYLREYLKNKTH